MIHPQPKPITRKTVKRKKAKRERTVKQDVQIIVGMCAGHSEWMHLGEKKRARTRGMPPEIRHTTAGSLMGCTRHHRDYDDGLMSVDPVTDKGADGLLRVSRGAESCDL